MFIVQQCQRLLQFRGENNLLEPATVSLEFLEVTSAEPAGQAQEPGTVPATALNPLLLKKTLLTRRTWPSMTVACCAEPPACMMTTCIADLFYERWTSTRTQHV